MRLGHKGRVAFSVFSLECSILESRHPVRKPRSHCRNSQTFKPKTLKARAQEYDSLETGRGGTRAKVLPQSLQPSWRSHVVS